MKKINLFLILFLGLIFLTGCSANNSQNKLKKAENKPIVTAPTTTNTNQITEKTPPAQNLNLNEVAQHNTSDNCWMAINNQVYDLSAYTKAGLHPGGDKILNGCGKEATLMFESIGKHNDKAVSMLANYLLGPLQK